VILSDLRFLIVQRYRYPRHICTSDAGQYVLLALRRVHLDNSYARVLCQPEVFLPFGVLRVRSQKDMFFHEALVGARVKQMQIPRHDLFIVS